MHVSIHKLGFTLVLLSVVSVSASAAPVTFAINYNFGATVPLGQQTTVRNATDTSFARIGSWFDAVAPTTINVNFNFFDQGSPTLLGSAGASNYQLVGGIYYPNALDKFIRGAGSSVIDTYDLDVNMNAAQNWDFTFATPSNATQFSYAETLYHEGFHALGFSSSLDQAGALGFTQPTIWDTRIEGFTSGTWQPITALTPAQRAAAMIGGNTLRFTGAMTAAIFGGSVGLYAPATWEEGSSGGSHTDLGQNLINMEPSGPPGRYSEPGATEKAMLADIGWRLSTSSSAPEPGALALLVLGGICLIQRRRSTATR